MSTVHLEFDGPVAIVTTSNPPAELFDEAQISGLLDAIAETTRVGARAMVIKSDAPAFSGGADVNAFVDKDRSEAHDFLGNAMKVIWALEDAPFPIVAAVNGFCFAAGLELALACDFIYAADDTLFSQVESLIGATTFLGGAYRLAERCGPAVAREIVYTSTRYSAEQFAQWNIVNRVVPLADLHAEAVAVAQKIAAGPMLAHTVTKRIIRHALAHDSRSADAFVLDEATPLFESKDMQGAINFLLTEGARRFANNHDEIRFDGV